MASTTQEKLFESFVAVSGEQATNLDEIAASLADVASQIGQLQRSNAAEAQSRNAQVAAGTAAGNSSGGGSTAASLADVASQIGQLQRSNAAETQSRNAQVAASTAAGNSSGGGSIAASIASTVLKSGFGLVPLISGLLGLFGGGGTPAPAPLLKYVLPAPIPFQTAETEAGVGSADYDQMGMPRMYGAGAASGTAPASPASLASSSGGDASGRPAPQITVNVQAMDARSFLDHSNEIARAVRDAMLNLNAINDVVNDL
jgi:hypothetical protein